jgi:hypothetical protein
MVAGFPALALHRLLREYGPKHLAALERSVELGKVPPELLTETREVWADIAAAAALWVQSEGSISAASVEGTLSAGPAETPSGSSPWEITTAEAGAMLHLCPRRVVQLLAAGHLTGRKAGRVWLVERVSVEVHRREMR